MEEEPLFLPPGFRFHPTDEEIISQYLSKKVADQSFSAVAVGEANLNSCEPWDLPKKAKMGEKAWYFCQKDRKYPTGKMTNRATETGYWKATGKDKEIHRPGRGRVLVGMKKTLVFYMGRAPKGEKTNWVMHEFRLEGSSHLGSLPQVAMESWVVCRVFHKNEGIKKTPITEPSSVMSMEAAPGVGQQFNEIHIQNQENLSQFVSQIPPPNPFFPHGGSAGSGYLGWPEEGRSGRAFYAPTGTAMSSSPAAFVGQCKAEQVSNSMPASHSQEPGMSSGDLHPEISSYNIVADGSSSADPLFGLDNFWEC